MITAALEGALDQVEYRQLPIFGLNIPLEVPGVPSEILNPKDTWKNQGDYDTKAKTLAQSFIDNFKDFEEYANEEIMEGAPTLEAIKN
jgi:phosphoenolpyruvate carboxykinase (ATP)